MGVLTAAHLASEGLKMAILLTNDIDILSKCAYAYMEAIIVLHLPVLLAMAITCKNFFMFRVNMSKESISGLDNLWQPFLRFKVVRAIHQKEGISGGLWQNLRDEQFNTSGKFFWNERHPGRIGVAAGVGEMRDKHAGAVRSSPVKFVFACFVPNATPEDSAINPKTIENLRQLSDMPKAVGDVADAHRVSKFRGSLQANLQVTYQGFTADEELVGLQIPGADYNTPGTGVSLQTLFLFGFNLQVVIQDDGLTVEHEVAEFRVAI